MPSTGVFFAAPNYTSRPGHSARSLKASEHIATDIFPLPLRTGGPTCIPALILVSAIFPSMILETYREAENAWKLFLAFVSPEPHPRAILPAIVRPCLTLGLACHVIRVAA